MSVPPKGVTLGWFLSASEFYFQLPPNIPAWIPRILPFCLWSQWKTPPSRCTKQGPGVLLTPLSPLHHSQPLTKSGQLDTSLRPTGNLPLQPYWPLWASRKSTHFPTTGPSTTLFPPRRRSSALLQNSALQPCPQRNPPWAPDWGRILSKTTVLFLHSTHQSL